VGQRTGAVLDDPGGPGDLGGDRQILPGRDSDGAAGRAQGKDAAGGTDCDGGVLVDSDVTVHSEGAVGRLDGAAIQSDCPDRVVPTVQVEGPIGIDDDASGVRDF